MVRICLFKIFYGALERRQPLGAHALVKGEVGLVSYAVFGGSVNDGFVEVEDGVVVTQQMLGYLLDVCVEADAKCLDTNFFWRKKGRRYFASAKADTNGDAMRDG